LAAHGVAVKVLTGDNELVTAKICREVGLEQQGLLMGNDVERMSDAELAVAVEHTNVFAKLTPSHKERIVRLLKGNGHVVGFMGDGINDAPALRTADIGISVDSAVDIAKEAADIIPGKEPDGAGGGRAGRAADLRQHAQVHQDDGQLELRQRVLGAGGQCIHSVPADAADAPAGAEPALRHLADCHSVRQRRRGHAEKPQRWQPADVGRFMLFFGPISSIFDITTFALMWYVFDANTPDHQTLFQSGWFVVGLLTQTLIVHMIRTPKIPFLQSRAAMPLMVMTAVIMAVGIFLPMGPLAHYFKLQALPSLYFVFLPVILLAYMGLTQAVKGFYIRRFGWQ
jgi:Mg2+-importing ATPase